MILRLRTRIPELLAELAPIPVDDLLQQRYDRIRKMGEVFPDAG